MDNCNYICYDINLRDNFKNNLSFQTINILFANVDELESLKGVNNINYCYQTNSIRINTSYYKEIIYKTTGYNLCNDFRAYQITEIYNKLDEFIKNNEEYTNKMFQFLENYNCETVEKYNELFIHSNDIKILHNLFKVMSENNLCLFSSF